MSRSKVSRSERGAVAFEAAISSVILFGLIGLIFDFGMLIHRHALLVDMAQRTVQDVSRDYDMISSSSDKEAFIAKVKAKFATYKDKLAGAKSNIAEPSVDCNNNKVQLTTTWSTSCVFCWTSHFTQTLRAESVGMLETPDKDSVCNG